MKKRQKKKNKKKLSRIYDGLIRYLDEAVASGRVKCYPHLQMHTAEFKSHEVSNA